MASTSQTKIFYGRVLILGILRNMEEVAAQAVEGLNLGPKSGGSENTRMESKFGFQVADVQKPLVSVKRIVGKGNLVQFGTGMWENYIFNKSTGHKFF